MDSPRGRHQQPETCEDEDQAGQPLAAGHKGRRGPTTTSDGPGGGRCHGAPAQGGPQEARRISDSSCSPSAHCTGLVMYRCPG